MNAPNLSSNNGDFESLQSTQHVPSMDDILTEIRRSIMAAGTEPATMSATPRISGSQIVTDTSISPALAGTRSPLAAHLQPLAATPRVARKAESSTEPAMEKPIASPATEAAVAACFDALSASVAMQGNGIIEGLTRDMLRPLLTKWLDENLPVVVERLVRAEIQRVSRGGH